MRKSRIAESLLRGFIPDPDLEDAILGDLAEERHERAESSGPGPADAWYRAQLLRSIPHLLWEWWLLQSPGQALRTVARVALVLALAASCTVAFAETSPRTLSLAVLGPGVFWAAAGGFYLAWTASSGAPMCSATLLGLSWIPYSAAAFVLLESPGPPVRLLVLAPIILLALSLGGGTVATLLRSIASAHAPLSATDPSTTAKTMKTTRTVLRLFARPMLATVLLLTVPLVAMQLTGEVNWTPFDFAVMGALIVGTGVVFELALMKAGTTAYRAAAGVALASAFLLVWVNLAVGIIGSSANGANVLYYGVLAVGGVGSLVARFRPRGMARAMVATALAHTGVGMAALIAGWAPPFHVLGLTGMFSVLFLASAWLFWNAASSDGSPGHGADALTPAPTVDPDGNADGRGRTGDRALYRWIRPFGGALGMGLVWAAGWAIAGVTIGLVTEILPGGHPLRYAADPYAALATPGFLGGVVFAAVLRIAEGRRRFVELSPPRAGSES